MGSTPKRSPHASTTVITSSGDGRDRPRKWRSPPSGSHSPGAARGSPPATASTRPAPPWTVGRHARRGPPRSDAPRSATPPGARQDPARYEPTGGRTHAPDAPPCRATPAGTSSDQPSEDLLPSTRKIILVEGPPTDPGWLSHKPQTLRLRRVARPRGAGGTGR